MVSGLVVAGWVELEVSEELAGCVVHDGGCPVACGFTAIAAAPRQICLSSTLGA